MREAQLTQPHRRTRPGQIISCQDGAARLSTDAHNGATQPHVVGVGFRAVMEGY